MRQGLASVVEGGVATRMYLPVLACSVDRAPQT